MHVSPAWHVPTSRPIAWTAALLLLSLLACGASLCGYGASRALAGEPSETLQREALEAWQRGQTEQALELAGRAIAAAPDDARTYALRARFLDELDAHERAVADYDQVLRLAPDAAWAFDRRGSLHFKLGHIERSLADFDRAIELDPARGPRHWQRGISCYYAGQYDAGQRQFEAYQTVDARDVENVVWRYLCMARAAGHEAAREALIPVEGDRRVPMHEIWQLFAGKATPDDVLLAAEAGEPQGSELRSRRFYAHLYLGLFAESENDEPLARAHLTSAVEQQLAGHYMWHVARVHADRLRGTVEKRGDDQ